MPITFEFTGVVTGLQQTTATAQWTSEQWPGSSISGTIVMDLSDPSLQVASAPFATVYEKNELNPSTGWLQVNVRNPDGTHFVIDQPDPVVNNSIDGAYTNLIDEGFTFDGQREDMFSVFRWTNSNYPNPRSFVLQVGSTDPYSNNLVSDNDYSEVLFDVTQANFINQGEALVWFDANTYDGYTFAVTALGRSMQVVPEPATLAIFIVGLLGFAFRRLPHRPTRMRAGQGAVPCIHP